MPTSDDREPDEYCDVPGCDEAIVYRDGDHYEVPGGNINVMCADHGEKFLEHVADPSEGDD